jgi:peptidoglycan/LPS O-acetylase OafA/YrhL
LVSGICNEIFKRIAITQYQFICFGLELIAAIIFAWLFYMLIEKSSMQLSKKFIYQKTSPLSIKYSLMRTR